MSAMTIVLFIIGLGFLIGGAEALVRGASRLAAAVGISPLVIGLTVVAFGTSVPELAVSVRAGYFGQADVALGNVVGSNICNVLLILGAAAAVAPLAISARLVRFDVWVMIGVSLILLMLVMDGRVGRVDSLLLLAGAVAYTAWLIYESRKRDAHRPETAPSGEDPARKITRHNWLINVGLVLLGLVLLTVGAQWLVNGAVTFARALGISELIVGLTIVAVGTSLPELATSVVAAARGQRDIAVGNVVGSNIFNILVVLGLSAAVSSGGYQRVACGACVRHPHHGARRVRVPADFLHGLSRRSLGGFSISRVLRGLLGIPDPGQHAQRRLGVVSMGSDRIGAAAGGLCPDGQRRAQPEAARPSRRCS